VSGSTGFGVVLRDLPGAPATLAAGLDAAAAAGAGRLQVPSLLRLDPALDPAGLRAARAEAAARGLRLDAQLGVLNAVRPERNPDLLRLGDGDPLRGVERTAAAAAIAGIETLHFTIGQLEDREPDRTAWSEQLERSAVLVAAAAEVAAAHAVRLVLKTHEEMSSTDVLAVVDACDGAIGVGLSPVNLLIGLEEPGAATRRLAGHVDTVFLDDASLVRTPGGYRRRMEPLGHGTIDWPEVLSLLSSAGDGPALTLDIHRAAFDIPCFDPGWSRCWPDVTVGEFAALAGASTAEPVAPESGWDERFATGAAWLRAWTTDAQAAA